MLPLPHAVDAEVLAEIDRQLDQNPGMTPVPVHKLAANIRLRTKSKLPIAALEGLIVDEAGCRHLPMLFESPRP
ncbi:hypothetical protein AB4Z43_28625 [Mesorhizobium sp. 2RAF45]|uniref:hypothetical protein n=1 Tax=Mesorhizobium sp. 2RAF45 TaxID=3233001 RepID=UPI003F9B387B